MSFLTPHEMPNSEPNNNLEGHDHSSPSSPESEHYEPKFNQIKEDLHNLFNINVTSEISLQYPWVIDELYTAAVDELMKGTPWGFDYMVKENLLTKKQIVERGVTKEMKNRALDILENLKGPRFLRAKELFIETGILEESFPLK